MVVKTAQQTLACKEGPLHVSTWPSPHDHMLSLSDSWPWPQQFDHEEPPHFSSIHSSAAKGVAASPVQVATSVADHCHKQQQRPYSLSSRAAASTSRSAISSIYTTSAGASPSSDSSHGHASNTSSSAASDPKSPQITSLWDDDADDECAFQQLLPPLDPCDYMKTLLTQLASCISSISTAYGHQQAAMHSQYSLQLAATDGAEDGRGASAKAGIISTTDKAMAEELKSLSRLHSQLALLLRRLLFEESGAEGGATGRRPDMKEGDESASYSPSLQLRRYEEVICRFHDEICRKDAVVEALKETLAKSMLKGEKLQQRVQALDAKLSTHPVDEHSGR